MSGSAALAVKRSVAGTTTHFIREGVSIGLVHLKVADLHKALDFYCRVQYTDDAEKFGLQIHHVFLTHFHADFVAGHLELRDRCGAVIHLGSRAQAEYPFSPMQDGDVLEFPNLRLQVLETPIFGAFGTA